MRRAGSTCRSTGAPPTGSAASPASTGTGRPARGGERRWATLDEIVADAATTGHDPFVLVLEHLQDPTNFGTLLRAAEAAGVDGVVFPSVAPRR
jgi:tRNA G18 (ribose-2'-O)-methylase SpoU